MCQITCQVHTISEQVTPAEQLQVLNVVNLFFFCNQAILILLNTTFVQVWLHLWHYSSNGVNYICRLWYTFLPLTTTLNKSGKFNPLFTNHIWKHDACQAGRMAKWCYIPPSILNAIIVNHLEGISITQQSIKMLKMLTYILLVQ